MWIVRISLLVHVIKGRNIRIGTRSSNKSRIEALWIIIRPSAIRAVVVAGGCVTHPGLPVNVSGRAITPGVDIFLAGPWSGIVREGQLWRRPIHPISEVWIG
jgi:hypothetical protein